MQPQVSHISVDATQGIEDGLFQPRSKVTTEYMNDLAMYTSVMAPITWSIKALESQVTYAADVFIFWLGIAASLCDLFSKSSQVTGITSELAGKVTRIVNRRYKEFIDNSPTDVYFAAFFLDPRMFRPPCHFLMGINSPGICDRLCQIGRSQATDHDGVYSYRAPHT